jgi:DNA-binding MarR family transcriptional regulator
MPRKPDERSVVAARDIVSAVSRFRRRIRAVADNQQLSPSQTSVLGALARGGAATASDLAGAEGVRPQSMAATLAVLETRELIRRRPDPSDGRRQVVTLTRDGADLYRGNRAARQEWLVDAIAQHLTPAEQRTLIDAAALMEKLTDS